MLRLGKFVAVFLLTIVLTGIYGIVIKRDLIKTVIGLIIAEYGAIFLLMSAGYTAQAERNSMSGPALLIMITGLAVTAIMAALALRVREKYGTFDLNKIRKLKG